MKKLVIIISAMCLLVTAGCSAVPSKQETFDFIFRYGVYPEPKNELDTLKNTIIKDMITDPSVTTKLTLTPEEMNNIHARMQEIDIFGYPDVFTVEVSPGDTFSTRIPYQVYYFYIQDGSRIKELRWEDKIQNLDEQAAGLRRLIQLIQDIISSKEEYRKLPVPTSGYQ